MNGSIAVIGGGILGLFTAWELAQRERAVTLFDAGALAGGCLHWAGVGDAAQLAGLRTQFAALRALDYPATWLDGAALAFRAGDA